MIFLRGRIFGPLLQHSPHRRMMFGFVTANLLWSQGLCGQRLYSTFGAVAELPLDYTPAGLAVRNLPSSTHREVALLSQNPPAIQTYALSDSGTIQQRASIPLARTCQGLMCQDIDGDGEPEFVALSSDGSLISVVKRVGTKFRISDYPSPAKAQHLALADINNDGVVDILVFGKTMTGVGTLLGRKGGGFRRGPDLFPEISVSSLQTLDVNGDGILDVIVCNWLSNQLTLFYGISRMVFSEQITIDLPAEPGSMSATWLSRKSGLGIAVTLPSEKKVALLRCSPAGDLQLDGTMQIPGWPTGVALGMINEDQYPDMAVATDKGIAVALGVENFGFLPPVFFGPGAASVGFCLVDLDGDRRLDLAVAERLPQKLVFLANEHHSDRVRWPLTYAVGSRPRGLAVHDIDGDGLPDIAVANSNSSTISVLLNTGKGTFHGQQSMAVAERPVHLCIPETGHAEVHTIVSSHTTMEMIGVASWDSPFDRVSSFSIPAGMRPQTLSAWQDTASLSMLVRYPPHGRSSVSLSLFEQISGKQFLERSIRATLPERISAVTATRNSPSSYMVSFATFDESTKKSTVSVAYADRSLVLGSMQQLTLLDDSTGATQGLLPVSLGPGRSSDLLIILGKPYEALAILRGMGAGPGNDTLTWIRDVRVDDDNDIIVADVDGDGLMDIVVRNDENDTVMAYYGRKNGNFEGLPVCSAEGIDAIAVGSFILPGVQDLVVSHTAAGTISLVPAPFRRRP